MIKLKSLLEWEENTGYHKTFVIKKSNMDNPPLVTPSQEDFLEKLKKEGEDTAEDRETLQSTGFWGNQAAGCLILALQSGRILAPYRSGEVEQPNTWGTLGGKIDTGETPIEAVKREVQEEAGYTGNIIKIVPLYIYKTTTKANTEFRYYNFLVIVNEEFEPKTNWETGKFQWMTLDELLKIEPKHFGLKELLKHDAKKIEKEIGQGVLVELTAVDKWNNRLVWIESDGTEYDTEEVQHGLYLGDHPGMIGITPNKVQKIFSKYKEKEDYDSYSAEMCEIAFSKGWLRVVIDDRMIAVEGPEPTPDQLHKLEDWYYENKKDNPGFEVIWQRWVSSKYGPPTPKILFGDRHQNMLEESKENIVELIKKDLVEYQEMDSWKEFVDHQELGDCQLIVSSIMRLNLPNVKKHFGRIKIDDGTKMTHHWVTINGKIYEFSKGSLKDYIDWEDLYSVDAEEERYPSFLKENLKSALLDLRNYVSGGQNIFGMCGDVVKLVNEIIPSAKIVYGQFKGTEHWWNETNNKIIDVASIDGILIKNKNDQNYTNRNYVKSDKESVAKDMDVDIKYYRDLLKEDYEDWKNDKWIHYSKVPYLKFKYDPFHQDPIGIYLFPEKFKPRTMWREFPYKFIVEVPNDLKVLDFAKTSAQQFVDILVKMGLSNKNGFEECKNSILKDRTKDDYHRHPGDVFWEFIPGVFDYKHGAANKAFRKLGYDAIFDDTKSIHSQEDQLIILTPGKFKVVAIEERKGSGYRDVGLIMARLLKMVKGKGLNVTVNKPKKQNVYGSIEIKGSIRVSNMPEDQWSNPNYRSISFDVYTNRKQGEKIPSEIYVSVTSRPSRNYGVGARFNIVERKWDEVDKLKDEIEWVFSKEEEPVLKEEYIGNCVNILDDPRGPWNDATEMSGDVDLEENGVEISKDEFFKNIQIEPNLRKELEKEAKKPWDYGKNEDRGIYWIWDSDDIHWFFIKGNVLNEEINKSNLQPKSPWKDSVLQKTMTSGDAVDYVQTAHTRAEDFDEGDLIERIETFDPYHLKLFPIGRLSLDEWNVEEWKVDELKDSIKTEGKYIPIIIADYGEGSVVTILDGIHRANAVNNLGEKMIWAYVGKPKRNLKESKEIEFVCWNKKLGGTSKEKLLVLYNDLKQVPEAHPYIQDWSEQYPNDPQISLSVIYNTPETRRKIVDLAKKHRVKIDLDQQISSQKEREVMMLKEETTVDLIKKAKEIVMKELNSRGIKDDFIVKVKDFDSRKKSIRDWLAMYRNQTQFRSKPVFWVNNNFYNTAKQMGVDPLRGLVDTIFHEYGHVVWEFFHWHGWWENNEVNRKIKETAKLIDMEYSDQEEFAEDFMKEMNRNAISNTQFFDIVTNKFKELAFL